MAVMEEDKEEKFPLSSSLELAGGDVGWAGSY